MVLYSESNDQENGDLSARKADLIDKHVGQRLRDRRRALDLSQQDIGQILGISYQQVQKYECGLNRISAGRMYILAHIMQVNVSHFYEGLPPADELIGGRLHDLDITTSGIENIPTGNVQNALNDLVRAIRDSKLM